MRRKEGGDRRIAPADVEDAVAAFETGAERTGPILRKAHEHGGLLVRMSRRCPVVDAEKGPRRPFLRHLDIHQRSTGAAAELAQAEPPDIVVLAANRTGCIEGFERFAQMRKEV